MKESERPYIGYFGCEDRLVSAIPPRGVRKPHWSAAYKIDCPSCCMQHVVKPMWRKSSTEERVHAQVRLTAAMRV